ncbi:MAG: PAS domain-containing protein [Deltaproteobacteria bacterium]|nr:PAS domain-containing protein [Deltaproteobacteria bacterium]
MDSKKEDCRPAPPPALLQALFDSLKDPVVFVDTNHVIRYLNRRAVRQYRAGVRLLNRSLLDCHNEKSRQVIRETLRALEAGEEERLIHALPRKRLYMRAVRDADGRLLGYYERFEYLTTAAEDGNHGDGEMA